MFTCGKIYQDLFRVYHSDDDINGKRLINCDDADDVGLECDYAYVHFFMPYETPLIDGNLYILGELANWQFGENNLMHYNYEKQGYEGMLFLKEGYYNYLYAFLPNTATSGDVTIIEGNHYDTENDYYILVYYREPGSVYDELIGVEIFNSHKDS